MYSFLISFPLKVLQRALEEFGEPWDLNPGDGAFYGPKVSWGPCQDFYLFISLFCFIRYLIDTKECFLTHTGYKEEQYVSGT